MRLLLAQGVQGVGSVLSGLLAQKVFFKNVGASGYTSTLSLLSVQWTYLAITLFCALLALFFYYMPLPEVTDRELGRLASARPVDPKKRSIGGMSLRTWCIILAVIAQWTYVAAQETMSIWFGSLLTSLLPTPPDSDAPSGSNNNNKVSGLSLSVPDYLLVAHTAFAVSRFACGYIAYLSVKHPHHRFVPTPRTMLTISAALNVVFAILIVALRPTGNPNLLVIPIVLFFLAEGPLWPLIFALGLRGQGKRTKRAAAWLTMGGSGPAFWPFVIFAVINGGGDVHTAFIVVVVLLVFTFIYPLFLTFVKDAKVMVDPSKKGEGEDQGEEGGDAGLGRRQSRPSEVNLDDIIAARRRAASDAADGGGGVLHRIRSSFASMSGRRRSSAQQSSLPTGLAPAPAVVRPDGPSVEPDRRGAAAPWEHQELDTSILQEP
jgi:fucose permease